MNISSTLCEALMILFFGLSWPTSVHKSFRSRTAKGKSATFEILIWIGYVFGIMKKLIEYEQFKLEGTQPSFLFWFAWFFYGFNMLCITIDLILYVRNKRLDAKRDKEEAERAAKATEAAQAPQAAELQKAEIPVTE